MIKNSGVLMVNYENMDSSEKSDKATLVVGEFQDNKLNTLSHFHGNTAKDLYETLTTGKKTADRDLADRYYSILYSHAVKMLHENSIYGMAADKSKEDVKRILNSLYGIRSPYIKPEVCKPLEWRHDPNDKPIAKVTGVEWHPETGLSFNIIREELDASRYVVGHTSEDFTPGKKKVVILGSLSQLDELNEIAKTYRDAGNLVVSPRKSKSELKYTIRRLLVHIKAADLIVVLNKPNNQPLGDGVTYEVEFARFLNKAIIYRNPKSTYHTWKCDDGPVVGCRNGMKYYQAQRVLSTIESVFNTKGYITIHEYSNITGIDLELPCSMKIDDFSDFKIERMCKHSDCPHEGTCPCWNIKLPGMWKFMRKHVLERYDYDISPSKSEQKEEVDTRSDLEKECDNMGGVHRAVNLWKFRVERKYKLKLAAKAVCWQINTIADQPYGISITEFCKQLGATIPHFNYINPDEYRWYGKDSFEINRLWPNNKPRYEILPTKMPVKVCK